MKDNVSWIIYKTVTFFKYHLKSMLRLSDQLLFYIIAASRGPTVHILSWMNNQQSKEDCLWCSSAHCANNRPIHCFLKWNIRFFFLCVVYDFWKLFLGNYAATYALRLGVKKVYPRHKLMLPAIVLYDIFTWFDYIPTQICHRDYKWQTQPTKTVFITCFARIQICHQSNWKYTCPVQTNECKWGTCYISWPHLPSHRSAQKNCLHVCVCVRVCNKIYHPIVSYYL